MTARLVVSAKDVLSGKVDFDSLDTVYVAVSFPGIGRGALETLLEAMNYMVKLGWRFRGCLETYSIMERER